MSSRSSSDAGVGALVRRLTAELGGVTAVASGEVTELCRGGQLFAAVQGTRVALRLRPDIAEAALRTPATEPSTRGREWIEFQPDAALAEDVDRLQAWTTIAWRAAQPPH